MKPGDRVKWCGLPSEWWDPGVGTVVGLCGKLVKVHWDKDKKFPPEAAGHYFEANLALA